MCLHKSFLLTILDLIKIEKQTRTEHTREFIPNVIEPSFVSSPDMSHVGLANLTSGHWPYSVIPTTFHSSRSSTLTPTSYSLCEQVYWTREGSEARSVCSPCFDRLASSLVSFTNHATGPLFPAGHRAYKSLTSSAIRKPRLQTHDRRANANPPAARPIDTRRRFERLDRQTVCF